MTDEPEDHEAIIALNAYSNDDKSFTRYLVNEHSISMRRALDAAAAWRRAQPASGLADHARKIAEALRKIEQGDVRTGGVTSEDAWECRGPWSEIAWDALPLAESQPGKIEALERKHTLDRIDWWHEATNTTTRAEAAESQLATMTKERDEWRSCTEEKIALLQREVDAHRKRIEASNVFEEMWRSAEKETIDLESQLAERDAEIGRMREALQEIADRHIGDCPSALDINDADWNARCHSELRRLARAALSPPIAAKQDDHNGLDGRYTFVIDPNEPLIRHGVDLRVSAKTVVSEKRTEDAREKEEPIETDP